ncbi:MAG: phage tail protein [Fusicatenibacter saccharivorans]|uniref:Phage tail protein n=1 Tax=Fusicatenibacter saccharivorans TaxID=1150298 RepID=A0A939CF72_9FIRM|nr:phage tail protein [Fusicatenibacter saccharivorans]
MYTIKAFVDGKEYTLHNPKIRNLIVGDPYYQKGDNVNGQASFSVYPKHPYYQYVKKLTTDIVIYKDDVEKFAGRVLYDDQDSKGVKKVFVEGELAYFCDSVQRPNVYHNISVRDYVSKIIDNHNAQVEGRKQFTLGRVTVTDPNDSLYRYANWESTRDTLKTKLVERLGGHLVIRKENGVRYLDYLSDDDFYRQNTQEIRFGKNLLDYSENMDASDLVTCVIPLGATLEESSIEGLDERLTISSVNGGVDYVSSNEAIAAYGKIYKTVTWDDVTVPANLLRKGKEYLKSTQFENMVLNIKAVDLNLIDSATQEFEVGDLIRCVSPPHGLDTNMPLSSITVYLTDLSKNTVTLGSEKSNSTYTSSNAEKASKLDETIKSIPGKREILQEALRNATDLMNDMTKSGYAIHEKNEFIVADAAGAKTATNLWRWGLGGLAHYSHGYDGPIDGIALTMDGQINGKMLMANSVTAEKIDVEYTETIEGAISDATTSSNKYTDKQQKLLKEEVSTAIKNTENRVVLSASSLKEYVSRKNYIVNGEQETLAIGNFSISGAGANAKVELTEFLNMKCLKVSFSTSTTVQIKQSIGTLEASTYTICCDAAFEDGKQPANLQVGFSDSAATNDLSSYSPGAFQVFKYSVKTSEEKEKTVAITVHGTSGTALYLTNIRCLEDLAEIVDNVNSSLKIEIDNVAINVDKKFRDYSTTEETSSMIQTKINEINLAISNAYATKDQLTDKYKDAIAAAEKAAGMAEENAKQDTADKLKSYSTTVQMNAAIKVATDEITLGVSQTYVTQKTYESGISNAANDATKKANAAEKNAKDDTTKKLTAYSSTKEMNAAIQVAIDGITSTVTQKISEIQVGGRNLVKNSYKLDGQWSAAGGFVGSTKVVEDTDALSAYHIETSCTTAGSGPHYPVFSKKSNRVGKTYTWSFWAKCSVEKTGSVGHECGGQKKITVTTEWQKFSHTWTYTDGQYSSFTFYLGFKVGEILYIRDFMVEEGNKASSWSPAPEDFDASVAAVDGKFASYSTTAQVESKIEQARKSITASVSETYVTKTVYSNGISAAAKDASDKAAAAESNAKKDAADKLKSYSTTEQMNAAIKIATDGITSNVSKTYVTQTTYDAGISSAKTDATNKANAAEKNAKDATANSLKSYSTTEQMNSAIKQKADSIETEVSKKVGSTEIISKINQSPESVAINASKISLNGAVTANSNFKINTDGSAETKALKITGGSLEIGGNCEITRKGDVFALSPKFVSGMYLSNEVSIGVELSKKSYSMIMGYVGKDVFVGESTSTLRGYGFTANNDIYAYGKLGCMGEKTRIIHTDDGRNAEMYAYETASPTFGDIGTGKIDNDGYCYVYLENDFLATIEKNMKYHVTLTAKGPGELYVESTNENDGYFLVKGTPKLEFYWEARVRQKGCRDTRIEESNIPEKEDVTAEDQEMINEQIRNQAILLCEMEKDENEVRDEQSNLIERMEELS